MLISTQVELGNKSHIIHISLWITHSEGERYKWIVEKYTFKGQDSIRLGPRMAIVLYGTQFDSYALRSNEFIPYFISLRTDNKQMRKTYNKEKQKQKGHKT